MRSPETAEKGEEPNGDALICSGLAENSPAAHGNGIARYRVEKLRKGREKQLQCEEIHFCLFAEKHIVFYGGMYYDPRT